MMCTLISFGPVPWSIATPHRMLYKREKSMHLEILEKGVPASMHAPDQAAWVIDVFANIKILKEPSKEPQQRKGHHRTKWKPKTFACVAEFIVYYLYHIFTTDRVDFVVDKYYGNSIKNAERECHSTSAGHRVKISSASHHRKLQNTGLTFCPIVQTNKTFESSYSKVVKI